MIVAYSNATPKARCSQEMNVNHATYRLHASDPTKYYICNWGTAVQQNCSATTIFSPWTCVCDYPKNVRRIPPWVIGCGPNGVETKPRPPPITTPADVTSSKIPVTTPAVPTTTSEVTDSPCTEPPTSPNKCNGVCIPGKIDYFEYVPDETKFCHCDNGVAVVRDCAPGTKWDQSLWTCDHI